MKRCPTCGVEKAENQFHREKRRKSGLQSQCKSCQRELHIKYYARNREEIRRKARIHAASEASRVKARIRDRIRAKKHPEILGAHMMVKGALLIGLLKKPTICEKCQSRRNLEAHHEDYSKPLEIMWLCRECHISKHRK